MDKWVPVVLIVVLLAGSGGGYYLASNTLQPRITSLESQLTTVQQQLNEKTQDYTTLNNDYQTLSQEKASLESSRASLQSSYDALKTNYDTLQSNYGSLQTSRDSLQADYTALSTLYDTLSAVNSDYTQLSEDYVALKKQYDALSQTVGNNVYKTIGYTQMLEYFHQLTLSVRTFNATLRELCDETTSFKNTLTTSEILGVESAVREAVGSSTDFWSNYQKIHEYVTSNIEYVNDIESPSISSYSWIDVNGVRYLTGFDTTTTRNYIQKPSFTLEYKQGDCDDQAHLEYAMLRYNNKYIVGNDYRIFIAWVFFSDETSHVAVFQPVSGGKLTILDPAGNYLTSESSTIRGKDAASELDAYNTHWSSQGSITSISLYSIDITDGSYTVVVDGTVTEVASYLTG